MFLCSTVSTLKAVASQDAATGSDLDEFAQVQFIEDAGLACVVQSEHQNSHLLLAEELPKDLGEHVRHRVLINFRTTLN